MPRLQISDPAELSSSYCGTVCISTAQSLVFMNEVARANKHIYILSPTWDCK